MGRMEGKGVVPSGTVTAMKHSFSLIQNWRVKLPDGYVKWLIHTNDNTMSWEMIIIEMIP